MVNTAIIRSQELGSNCWLVSRFVKGGRCKRVHTCDYPEKSKCVAVQTEIDFLSYQIVEIHEMAMKRQQMNAGIVMGLLKLQAKK